MSFNKYTAHVTHKTKGKDIIASGNNIGRNVNESTTINGKNIINSGTVMSKVNIHLSLIYNFLVADIMAGSL